MSELERAYGFIAVLEYPYNTKNNIDGYNEIDYITEKFENDKSCLNITYNGKCIYRNLNKYNHRKNTDLFFIRVGDNPCGIEQFYKALDKYKILIKPNTVKSFDCVWYNGTDCPINELTPEQVIKEIKTI